MNKIRVLIVDDAVVVRTLVSRALNTDPAIEVVGTAANGVIALNKIAQYAPDLVTMDVEMPEMDGLQTLVELRKKWPRLPVIMFSTLTERGAVATLEALSLGANDYVTKPANVGSITAGLDRICSDLIPKIKHWCPRVGLPTTIAPPAPAILPRPPRPQVNLVPQRIDIVAIGVSTGGPNALAELLPVLPADLPVPVLIVQHMPPTFTRLLAERLNAQSAIQVREAFPGAIPKPGEVWIAPGDYHLMISKAGASPVLEVSQAPAENFCRPSVDVLFRSVAEKYGANSLGVILTGMGHDGFRGSEAIHAAGGQIIAQDEASSVVWGMPSFVVKAGLADAILPPAELAREINRRVHLKRPSLSTDGSL